MATLTLRQRFEAKVNRTPGSGPSGQCHVWTGGTAGNGYGHLKVGRRMVSAHRVAWFLEFAAWPPEGLLVLHAPLVCNTPLCVNVDHLRLGTRSDNMVDRLIDQTNPQSIKTHCPAGHAYDNENTYRHGTKRYCRACRRLAVRRYDARIRAMVTA